VARFSLAKCSCSADALTRGSERRGFLERLIFILKFRAWFMRIDLIRGRNGSVDQWISGGRRSHGGAEARRKQREESTTGHKGKWRVAPVLLPVC
jgi:hypothetical protein